MQRTILAALLILTSILGYSRTYSKDLEKSAKGGNVASMLELSAAYHAGNGITANEKKAEDWFAKAAKASGKEMMFNLAEAYKTGHGLNASGEKAAKWYKEAAKAGHKEAMLVLGKAYQFGDGAIAKDESSAIQTYEAAYKSGNNAVAGILIEAFSNGAGSIRRNESQAQKWLKVGAGSEDPKALAALGRAYAEGKIFKKDLNKAKKYYSQAAERGGLDEKIEYAVFIIDEPQFTSEQGFKLLDNLELNGAGVVQKIIQAYERKGMPTAQWEIRLKEIEKNRVGGQFHTPTNNVNSQLIDTALAAANPPVKQPDGSGLRYSKVLKKKESDDLLLYKYVIIDFPRQGTYYGIVDNHTNKPLYGKVLRPDGTQEELYNIFPGKRAKTISPGQYLLWEKGDDWSKEYEALTFNANGTVTFTYHETELEQTWQEIAQEYTKKQRVNGRTVRKQGRQLTGGWFYDLISNVTVAGRWKLDGDELVMDFTAKPVIKVTHRYNEKALIADQERKWADHDVSEEVKEYFRQYMAQARADYPNYRVYEAVDRAYKRLEDRKYVAGKYRYTVLELQKEGMVLVLPSDKDNRLILCKIGSKRDDLGADNRNDVLKALSRDRLREFLNKRDQMEIRVRKEIESSINSQTITDWRLTMVDTETNKCSFEFFEVDASGNKKMKRTEVILADDGSFDAIKAIAEAEVDNDLEQYFKTMRTNEAQLETFLASNDKTLKDKAKEYFSAVKNHTLREEDVCDIATYNSMKKALIERIRLQDSSK